MTGFAILITRHTQDYAVPRWAWFTAAAFAALDVGVVIQRLAAP